MSRGLLATNPTATPVAFDSTATDIETSAWVEIEDSLTDACSAIQFFNDGSEVLILGVGAAAAEVDTGIRIFPGQPSPLIPIEIRKGKRLALKAIGATQTAGYVVINFFG